MILDLILLATQATKKAAESSHVFEEFIGTCFGIFCYIFFFGLIYIFLFKPEELGECDAPF